MKFILNEDKLTIKNTKKDRQNSGSIKYYEAEVEYDESWNGLTIEAIIVKEKTKEAIAVSMINNKVYIDTDMQGIYSIGFVGYTLQDNSKIYQISTNLRPIPYDRGAGQYKTSNKYIPSATEWEIYIAQIQEMLEGVTTIPARRYNRSSISKKIKYRL